MEVPDVQVQDVGGKSHRRRDAAGISYGISYSGHGADYWRVSPVTSRGTCSDVPLDDV